MTAVQNCGSTFVNVEQLDIFKETIAQFPDVFTRQNQVFLVHLCACATDTGILKYL